MPGALLGAALYPLGLDGPVWIYVGAGIKLILWVARFIARGAAFDGAFAGVRALRAAVSCACGDERDHLADVDVPAQRHSARIDRDRRRDAGAALRRHRRALRRSRGGARRRRGARGRRQALQRLRRRAMADAPTATGAIPLQARAFDAPCDRLGCVAALPEGESLSIVIDRLAFDEDCARAEVVVSAFTRARRLQGEVPARRTGARPPWRHRPDMGRERLHARERPQPAREPPVVAGARARARRADRASWPWRSRMAPTRPTRRASRGRGGRRIPIDQAAHGPWIVEIHDSRTMKGTLEMRRRTLILSAAAVGAAPLLRSGDGRRAPPSSSASPRP